MLARISRPSSLAWLAIALVGCGFNPGGSTTDAGVSIDVPCLPACSALGDEAITCDVSGQPVRQACPYGCLDQAGTPVCASTLIPSNVDPDLLTTFDLEQVVGGIPFEAGARIAIDTDLGAIYKYPAVGALIGVRPAVQGLSNNIGYEQVSPTLAVLAVLELRVVSGSTLEVFGTRGLVIVSRLDAIVDGTVRADGGLCADMARRPSCAGPGAGRGGEPGLNATGCARGGNGVDAPLHTGGAGGGMATSGGAGGTSGTSVGGTTAENLLSCAGETLVPLAGGGGGGRAAVGGAGGGGGGGLQVTSYGTLRLGPAAVVTAVGAGGRGTVTANTGGGGGGAGGAILLEGATIDVGNGAISTAGGGGGGGRLAGRHGEDGRSDGMPALGGLGDGVVGTDGLGGNGAVNALAALAGSSNADGTLDGTGGGGGGLGRIRINSVRGDAVAGAGFVGRFSAGRTLRKPPAP